MAYLDFLWAFVWDGFVLGFCRHTVLLAALAIVAAVLGGAGRGMGLPLLFWHEVRWKQFVAGLAVVLLAAELAFVGFLLDWDRPDRAWVRAAQAAFPGRDYAADPTPLAALYLLGTAASLGLVGTAVAVGAVVYRRVRARPSAGPAGRTLARALDGTGGDPFVQVPARSPLVWGALTGVLVLSGLVAVAGRVSANPHDWPHSGSAWARAAYQVLVPGDEQRWRSRAEVELRERSSPEKVTWAQRSLGALAGKARMHLLAAAVFGVLGLAYAFGMVRLWGLAATPATALCTLLGLAAAAYGYLVRHDLSGGLVLLGLLALFFVLAGLPRYKVRLRALSDRYASGRLATVYPDPRPAPNLIPITSIPLTDGGGRKYPLAIVCASGGGIRAAAWTVAMLTELERALPGFPRRLRVVTGASGGMVGAAAFVSTLRPQQDDGDLHPHEGAPAGARPGDWLFDAVTADSLSPTVNRWVFRDLPLMFLPVPYEADRGEILERAWRRHAPTAFGRTFGDLRPGEAAGWRPSLVFSPMCVEDGRRVLISNLDLSALSVTNGSSVGNAAADPALLPGHTYSRNAYELARMFPDRWDAFPVRTAARLSASFPLVSTASVLPTEPRRRLVDAGYYDNYGVSVAAGLLGELLYTPAGRRWLRAHASGVAVVQLRDGVMDLSGARDDYGYASRTSAVARGAEDLTTPVAGLLSARSAVTLFRSDEQLEALSREFEQLAGHPDPAERFPPGFFTTATFEFGGEASLSWYLAGREKADIRQAAEHVRLEAEAVLADRAGGGGDSGGGPRPAGADGRCHTLANLVGWWRGRYGVVDL